MATGVLQAPAGLEIGAEGLVRRRLALLRVFAACDDVPPGEVALPALAASCDSNEQARRSHIHACHACIYNSLL